MDSSLGQAVGAVAPRHEPNRDQQRDDAPQQSSTAVSVDTSLAENEAASGLPISHGRFELPTELFSTLLKDAQSLIPA